MRGDGRISEEGLGTGGRDLDVGGPAGRRIDDPIAYVVHRARLVMVLDFVVGEGGPAGRTPVDEIFAAIDQALVMEPHEGFHHRFVEAWIQGEPLPPPVDRITEPPQLPDDRATAFGFPGPSALQKDIRDKEAEIARLKDLGTKVWNDLAAAKKQARKDASPSPKDEDNEEASAKKKARKDVQTPWSKVQTLHGRITSAMATCQQLENYLASDKKAWGWSEADEMPELRKRNKELANTSKRSRFWSDFFVSAVPALKKKYSDVDDFMEETKCLGALTTYVESVEQQITKITQLQVIYAAHG
jgi:hypothetical protein